MWHRQLLHTFDSVTAIEEKEHRMSHVTTIARESSKTGGNALITRIGALAVSLAVGVAIGYTLVELGDVEAGSQTPSVAADHEEFLRLNTTALGFAAAAKTPVVATRLAPVDHFTTINTTDLEGLAQAAAAPTVDQHFLEWNTTALEVIQPGETSAMARSSDSGDDFMYWNVGSLERPRPAYSDPAIGPR